MNKTRFAVDLLRAELIWRKYRNSTMIRHFNYLENLALASSVGANLSGAVVECGTWRGGMAAGLIEIVGKERDYWFFDSFEGLPPVTDEDGAAAKAYQEDKDAPGFLDNCRAELADFERNIARTGIGTDKVRILKGFFEDTLPALDLNDIGPIAILRLDADWYESTKICLDKFWDNLVVGGLILIDDYYTWDGCTQAVNEFAARTKPAQRLRQGPLARTSYLIKTGDSH